MAEQIAREVHVWSGLARPLLSYLDDCGLAAPDLRQDIQAWDSGQRMPITAWWSLLERMAQVQPVPALGLRIGGHVEFQHLGVLGYLAASCDTLGQALQRFQRFQPLLHNLSPSLASRDAHALRFGWDPSYGRSTLLSNEVVVSGLVHLARRLTGHDGLTPSNVEFPEPEPADAHAYEGLLGCPVRFKARTLVIHLPLTILELPINGNDPHLRALLDQQAQALLQALPQPDAFLSELQHLIVEALQEGDPSLKQVARRLAVPPRTLNRRLQERNLTYKGLLSQLRLQLAKHYLADRRLSLPEIALMLGYSEQSAFTRAFKRWCGQTPLHYRKSMP